MRRDGDDVIVGCYASRQSWQLRCADGVWTGTVGLCPQHHYSSHADQRRPYDADSVIGRPKSHATTCNCRFVFLYSCCQCGTFLLCSILFVIAFNSIITLHDIQFSISVSIECKLPSVL